MLLNRLMLLNSSNSFRAVGCLLCLYAGLLAALVACSTMKEDSARQPDKGQVAVLAVNAAQWAMANQLDAMSYQNMCVAYGILKVAEVTGSNFLREGVQKALRPELLEGHDPHRDNARNRREHQWFGFVPLELYRQTGLTVYLDRGLEMAEEQYAESTAEGMPSYTPRDYVDDIYGATTMQSLAYAATGETIFLERAVRQVLYYSDRFMQDNGLFLHSREYAPYFWARGNGWSAAAFAQLLMVMPEDHPERDRVLEAYRRMMKGLVQYQSADGMWYQLIDDHDSWPESSGTAMFLFAMSEGVRHGWLDHDPYREAVLRAWDALSGYVDQSWQVTEVSIGTSLSMDRDYYLNRPRRTGDAHGQAPLLWAAASLLKW